MRWLVLLLIAGCGDQLDPPCALPCGDGCPSGLTCSVGFCAEAGETCEPDLQKISAGAGFACGVDQLGRAWCWGDNKDRQIADTDRRVFERATVAGTRRWDSIATGAGHTCGLDGGELWCWGRNDRNQVTSAIVGDVPAPIRIEVDGATVEWTRVAPGYDYTCGIADRRLFCWGAGDAGKLGNTSPNDVPRPQAVFTDIADWIDVDAGLRHTCAVSKSLGVWCWGDGSSGQLGNARFNVKLEPQAAGLIGATQVAVGLDTSCAVTEGGELYCWGRASQGALGDPALIDPDGDNQALPIKASALTGWVEVAAAERYACGRRDDGSVHCWGTARAGGLGGGRWNQQRGFVQVLEDATSLTVGWNGTDADPGRDEGDLDLACATASGRVRCWGDNRAGQLAQGVATLAEAPVEVGGDHAWSAIAAGASHVCGIDDTDRAVYCWGSVELGQVAGRAAGRTNVCTPALCDVATPVAIEVSGDELVAGANHTCARSGTSLACWGDSRLGQTGTQSGGSIAPATIPGSWTSVFAGGNGTCGIESGQVGCWGAALESHLPEPDPELAGATAIGLGFELGCMLDAASELVCFGDNANGAFGNGELGTCGDGTCNADETGASCAADCGPAPLTRTGRTYAALAVGRRSFACGLETDGGVECWGDNTFGQIGSFELAVATVPNPIESAVGCSQISAGRGHACAVCGVDIICWGDARHGEVGAPTSTTPAFGGRTIPPPAGEAWAAVTVGDGFTCATTASKRALCWGTSLHGALGNGARGANLPVEIELEGRE